MTLRVLHLHSSFDPGGKELRSVQLINAFGRGSSIASSRPCRGDGGGPAHPAGDQTDLAPDFPAAGRPTPGSLGRWPGDGGHDLVLTYNFGAMDAVLAHTLFGDLLRLPPLVHHEDGFNQDEADPPQSQPQLVSPHRAGPGRALVVPSQRLEASPDEWHQPRGRVHRIVNGIDTAAYAKKPKADALPRLIKRGARNGWARWRGCAR
jgi:hypothetical protein